MGARRKEQAHTRERVEECAGKSVGRLGSFVEGVLWKEFAKSGRRWWRIFVV